jgi:hypothetical protein
LDISVGYDIYARPPYYKSGSRVPITFHVFITSPEKIFFEEKKFVL